MPIDFPTAAITEAAKAFTAEVSAPVTPAPTPSPEPSPAPVAAELAPEATPSVTPTEVPSTPALTSEPTPIDLDDKALYRVVTKVNGKEEVELLTGEQVRTGRMSNRKFTQSLQQIRQRERELLQEKQGIGEIRRRAEEASAILSDRSRLAAHIQQSFPGLTLAEANAMAAHQQAQPGYQPAPQGPPPGYGQPQGFDPDALASIGDIQAATRQAEASLGRQLTQFEQSLVQRLEEAKAQTREIVNSTLSELADAHEVSNYNLKIESSIENLKTELPALQHIPDINDLLRFKVSQLNPRSPEEMFELIDAQARAIAEGLDEVYNKRHQAALAEKAKLVSHGVETPAGVAPTFNRRPGHRGPDGKFDWNLLTQEAKARANLG